MRRGRLACAAGLLLPVDMWSRTHEVDMGRREAGGGSVYPVDGGEPVRAFEQAVASWFKRSP